MSESALRQLADSNDGAQHASSLIHSQAVLRAVLDGTSDYIWLKDTQGIYVAINAAAAAALGKLPADIVGKNDYQLFPPDVAERIVGEDRDLMASGKTVVFEEEFITQDSQKLQLHTVKNVCRGDDGRIFGVVGISRDITHRKHLETELRQREHELSEAHRIAQLGTWHWILDGDQVTWSDAVYRIFKRSPELPPPTYQEQQNIFTPESWARLQSLVQRAQATGEPYEADLEMKLSDGSRKWVIARGEVAVHVDGEVLELRGTVQEITERKLNEQKIALSEGRYRSLVRTTSEMVWTTTPDGNQTHELPEWQAFTGQTAEELAGFGWADAIHPDDRQSSVFQWQEAVATGKPLDIEHRLRHRDGTYRNMLVRAAPVRDAEGAIVEWVGMHTDITEQRQAERKLFEANQRLNALMRALPVGVSFSDDPSCERVEGNPVAYAQFEIGVNQNLSASATDESVPGRHVSFVQQGRQVETAELPLQRAVAENREVGPVQFEVHLSSGRRWFAECFGAPIRDTAGDVTGGVAVSIDISARKTLEEELRKINSRFRKLFESDLMGIGIPNRFGGFTEANDELLRMIGYTRADLEAGLVRWDVMTPAEYAALDAEHIAEAAARGSCTPYEKEYIRKDGGRVPILCGYALLEGSQDEYIGFVQDLTAQKEAESALREREQRFRALAESLPQLIWESNAAGENIYCNQRYQEYTGAPIKELMGRNWENLVHPEDMPEIARKWSRSLEQGEPYLNEFRLRRHDGAYRYFLARAIAMRNPAGQVERWLGSCTDIHDQKVAEEAMRRSEKLATAGRFAASIAHEINNPLAAVTNALYLALQDPALNSGTREYLQLAEQELARVAHVATQTLRFHKQSGAAANIDVSELMESIFSLFAPRFRSAGIIVQREYEAREKLYCYNEELRQVFANFISNALDATPKAGRFRIRIREARTWAGDGERGIRVTFADTGHGIRPELRNRLFEPFFTTKAATGTGLGLWVSDGIVRKHNGSISVRSSIGQERQGTVFGLFFPFDGLKERLGFENSASAGS